MTKELAAILARYFREMGAQPDKQSDQELIAGIVDGFALAGYSVVSTMWLGGLQFDLDDLRKRGRIL